MFDDELDCLLQSYHLPQEILEKQCDDQLFLKMAMEISNFDNAAPYFGITEAEINEIHFDRKFERSRKLHMLWKWKKKNGSRATHRALVAIFLSMKERQLAEIVLKYIKPVNYESSRSRVSDINPSAGGKYPKWKDKSAHEKGCIKAQLMIENEYVRQCYAELLDDIFISFKKNIDFDRLKVFLRAYGVNCQATNISGVLTELQTRHISWFNNHFLKVLVHRYGNDDDKRNLARYEKNVLIPYLQKSIFEIPSCSFSEGHETEGFIYFYLCLTDASPNGQYISVIQLRLSRLLGIKDGLLKLIRFDEGSIILIFALPDTLLNIPGIRQSIEKYFVFDHEKNVYTTKTNIM